METNYFRELFQSTHPVRGGTKGDLITIVGRIISIHPPREGWDALMQAI